LPASAPEYTSPSWGERYVLEQTVWHSHEDDVMSHQVYALRPVLFAPRKEQPAVASVPAPASAGFAPAARRGRRGAR
jgi:hypothetical protein